MYTRVYTTSYIGANSYDLWAKLENTQDPDRNEVKLYKADYPPSLVTPS